MSEICNRSGKVRYESGAAARRAEERNKRVGSRRFQAKNPKTRVYRCSYCGGFHITKIDHYRGVGLDRLPPISQRKPEE